MGRQLKLMELLELTRMAYEGAATAELVAEEAASEPALQTAALPPAPPPALAASPVLPPAPAGVICACCHQSFQTLKRHLQVEHGLDEASYRGRYGIPLDVPLVSASYLSLKAACVSAYRGEAALR